MTTYPKALNPVKVFLASADQIEPLEPIFAYYFRKYAVDFIADQKLIQDPDVKAFLPPLLEKVNPKKHSLALDKVADISRMHTFADNLFAKAQKAVDEKSAGLEHSQMFFSAKNYYEVVCHFEGNNEKVQSMMKHAAMMAVQLRKQYGGGSPATPSTQSGGAVASLGSDPHPSPSSISPPGANPSSGYPSIPSFPPSMSLPPQAQPATHPAPQSISSYPNSFPAPSSLPPPSVAPDNSKSVLSFLPPPVSSQPSASLPAPSASLPYQNTQQPSAATPSQPPQPVHSSPPSFPSSAISSGFGSPSFLQTAEKKQALVKTLRYAISSLEYDDWAAAKKFVEEALRDMQ
ncbi:putative Vta1 like [Monocercomonoides exilis]|uniref:putative Vta1 like n=1 Tax=Monocercomonoides exilis TaxID=2049356 RepID=UPI003559D7C7|nr:putative Vta1 like [Monocercomonoides exilis]|eukprot:MONOS_13004.1-p1 / transcript=MONOS_13004.1 / gene=MONOS_13004 / organism=Monocercomonoides_exilis_PA203 / gene_product=unspecified product / transcript_product=unspecified product / location=Mono_scaffold00765:19716-21084(-) / protein_length=345 / sequence_SO=supercontig / SO=protein_coding / is_pseudo=false